MGRDEAVARVTTMEGELLPLLDLPSIDLRWCAICGRTWPLNRHHVPPRSAGNAYRDGRRVPHPTITLCGSGNASGCHGLAHHRRLHFRNVDGEWWYLLTDEPTKYHDALRMVGWRPVPSHME